MNYCKRCMYPSNAKPTIIFDDLGVCSGCRTIESRKKINWVDRKKQLDELIKEYKSIAKKNNSAYDCIIPVSGGKDSTYQTYLMKEVYKMNPLLVTFNHTFNTPLGGRNLKNLVKQFSCDLIRFTANRDSIKKITSFMLKQIGDITWHYHSGIMTFPMQVAAQYKIPLIIWGEEGFSELTGMFNQDDMIEFTKMKRQEHDMRGYEPEDLIEKSNNFITKQDLAAYYYPEDEIIEKLNLRGIYLSNYISWNAKAQTDKMIKEYNFEVLNETRERTFNLYDKTEDAANGTHDYLKYLKFGYGRATDDASTEIRHGRMTREIGAEKVMKHDPTRPSDLDFFLDFLNISEKEFIKSVDHLRDKKIWDQVDEEKWQVKDSIANHVNEEGVEEVRILPKDQISSDIFLDSKNFQKKEKEYYNKFEIL
jgi:N-acetyl sugar amidotransferase